MDEQPDFLALMFRYRDGDRDAAAEVCQRFGGGLRMAVRQRRYVLRRPFPTECAPVDDR